MIIDTRSSVPPYEQLRRRIAAQIDTGELEADSRLPTVRELARQTGLANNTAARVYRELEAAGYIRTEGRRGTFVAARPEVLVDASRGAIERDPVAFCTNAEIALLRPEAFADQTVLDMWVDSEFTMVHRDGRLLARREALEVMCADAAYRPAIEDLVADRPGPSLVVLTYLARRGSGVWRHSTLWVGQAGSWRCRCRQSTPVRD
ncbi:regulatory protein, gntR family [Raineyella antarctica]|uniref:Regulatory protein, gntR family n=2 Tax=Raineyella antarctica TaxID=1577474 RepID=A0A1G6GFF3_9ACTN|nr:regulatory protein, gntR family [Raineyella antarctica]